MLRWWTRWKAERRRRRVLCDPDTLVVKRGTRVIVTEPGRTFSHVVIEGGVLSVEAADPATGRPIEPDVLYLGTGWRRTSGLPPMLNDGIRGTSAVWDSKVIDAANELGTNLHNAEGMAD